MEGNLDKPEKREDERNDECHSKERMQHIYGRGC